MSKETPNAAPDAVKTAGRGFLVITAAKVWFLVTSAVTQLGLPIFFGSAEQFGVFKVVTEAIGLLNMVMITGTLQAVSKLVSEQPDRANRMVTQAIKLQFFLGVPIAAGYAIASPWIADSFNDPTLTHLLQISSLIIVFYAFYAIFVGYLNGTKAFVKQATLDITFSTLKTAGILGLVALGFGVWGAVSGFVGAAGIIAVVAGIWVFRLMKAQPDVAGNHESRTGRLLGYLVLIMLYTFALNGLMRADLFVLKSVAGEVPTAMAGAEGIFKVISDKFSGFYGAVLNVARIPYQGVIAITFVIFPMISESTFQDDIEKTRQYIRTTFRYCALLIAGVAFMLVFNSDAIIAGLYSADYRAAADALSYLSVSIIFFAVYYVATTIIIGAGHPAVAVVVMTISLVVSAVTNYVLVSQVHDTVMPLLQYAPFVLQPATDASAIVHNALGVATADVALAGPFLLHGPEYMKAAAIATTIGMVTGCLSSIAWIGWKYKAWPPLATIVRLLVGAAVLYGIAYVFPIPAWAVEKGRIAVLGMVVVRMAVMGVALLAVLGVSREFTSEDLARVKRVVGRKK
ncbi:MAG: oligosaccharide flippase family protein [bacterium]